MHNVENIHNTFKQELSKIDSLSGLDNLNLKYLGRSGLVNEQLKKMKDLKPEEKKEFGQQINELKLKITQLIDQKKGELLEKNESTSSIDVTLPGTPYPKGSLHVISFAIEEISEIYEKIGFIRVSYPEVEWEYFSFESLNMPKGHPARDDFETSFIDFPPHPEMGKMVLTPHTSSGQNREMKRVEKPPIRMINISKCYRPNWDATHTPMFHQFEGMCVDKGINITHLKGTLDYFAKEYFGPETEIRLRPHHFQFTEPSFEVDITCTVCKGKGTLVGNGLNRSVQKCKICKSGWLELGGTGMTHPNVLKEGGIDPEIYTGWAFGFGIERIIMMKYGLDDIRNYYAGDIRFLEQF
ncbi:MAG: phenylalanine--tRNA ligase subunit alpha [bacterium]|nr:phenylalanine--tRNA ligase subunit alpha [bacterium]